MGVSYHYCRVCKQTYPDCGDSAVYDCEKCGEGLCVNCLKEHNDYSKLKYWGLGEPAIWNTDEEILEEFCPLCSPSVNKTNEEKVDEINN